MPIYPIIAIVTLGGLLYAEKAGNRRLVFIFKPLTSLLFILTALSGGLTGAYGPRLLAGLILCMIGDVALIPEGRAWFLAGLVSFLLGHIVYIFAFSLLASLTTLNLLVAALALLVAGAVLAWLWPHLGSMRVPVIIYVIAISIMAWSAWAVFFNTGLPLLARLLILAGAMCFYVSDIFVARNVFVKKSFTNRAWGLPLYYVGQFLLAFSISAL